MGFASIVRLRFIFLEPLSFMTRGSPPPHSNNADLGFNSAQGSVLDLQSQGQALFLFQFFFSVLLSTKETLSGPKGAERRIQMYFWGPSLTGRVY